MLFEVKTRQLYADHAVAEHLWLCAKLLGITLSLPTFPTSSAAESNSFSADAAVCHGRRHSVWIDHRLPTQPMPLDHLAVSVE